jgi:hypothetical protein
MPEVDFRAFLCHPDLRRVGDVKDRADLVGRGRGGAEAQQPLPDGHERRPERREREFGLDIDLPGNRVRSYFLAEMRTRPQQQ